MSKRSIRKIRHREDFGDLMAAKGKEALDWYGHYVLGAPRMILNQIHQDAANAVRGNTHGQG